MTKACYEYECRYPTCGYNCPSWKEDTSWTDPGPGWDAPDDDDRQ